MPNNAGVILKKAVDKGLETKLAHRLNRRQIEKLNSLAQIILAVIGAVGVATVAVVAPNALVALDYCAKVKKKFRGLAADEKQKKLERAFYYLRSSGSVKYRREGTNLKIVLTEKAEKILNKLSFRTLTVEKPKAWSKLWWLVAADIPTKEHRLGADQFRAKLKSMGFYPLQRTLWLYPYDPRNEIRFIAETYNISRFITVMEINRLDIEDENKVKSFFNL